LAGNRLHYPFCDGRSDLNAARISELRAPAAADMASRLRRVGDNDSADMSFLPDGNEPRAGSPLVKCYQSIRMYRLSRMTDQLRLSPDAWARRIRQRLGFTVPRAMLNCSALM
jgi:hypothetical protein